MLTPVTTTTSKTSELPLSLADARDALRIDGSELDTQVDALLKTAQLWCESVTSRSLRVTRTVTQTYSQWPCNPIRFDWQPVKAITSITYYDEDGNSQTVSSSNYRLIESSEGAAIAEFDADFSLPSVEVRRDAITITYTAGYDDLDSVPDDAKTAIRLKLRDLFGDMEEGEAKANARCLMSIIEPLKWRPYR